MKLLLYGIFACCSISGMEEFNHIKELINDGLLLKEYLESKDQSFNTPLMRLLDKGTDPMLEEILPALKKHVFDLEIAGASGETAFFNACNRPGTVAATLMLNLGVLIDAATPAGRPIYLTFLNDNSALLTLLIEEGANPRIPSEILAIGAQKPGYLSLKAALDCHRIP